MLVSPLIKRFKVRFYFDRSSSFFLSVIENVAEEWRLHESIVRDRDGLALGWDG